MLPAIERCQGVLELIAQKQYFVIHAARQRLIDAYPDLTGFQNP